MAAEALILGQHRVMNVSSFNNKNLKDLRTPCNTPESSTTHTPKTNVFTLDLHDDVMEQQNFSVCGFKTTVHFHKSFMLIPKKSERQEVRDPTVHVQTHKLKPSPHPKPCRTNITVEKLLISKSHQRPSLATFQLIEKSYQEKEKLERLKDRVENVKHLQNQRDHARAQRDTYLETQRTEALLRQERERDQLEKTLKIQKTKLNLEVQLAKQKNLRFLQEKSRNTSEREMVQEFNRQRSVLAKTITNHVAHQKLNQDQHEKRRHVTTSKEQEIRKQKIQVPVHTVTVR
ncbi:uncharacterized protein LOC134317959 [Trichomycterus rosablanca]|uniref:uncharacterized protein LOC134317959 n=1 Tax=Trichomycterus rosablanca TaxID=2290929 RepID=UPI002F34FBDF